MQNNPFNMFGMSGVEGKNSSLVKFDKMKINVADDGSQTLQNEGINKIDGDMSFQSGKWFDGVTAQSADRNSEVYSTSKFKYYIKGFHQNGNGYIFRTHTIDYQILWIQNNQLTFYSTHDGNLYTGIDIKNRFVDIEIAIDNDRLVVYDNGVKAFESTITPLNGCSLNDFNSNGLYQGVLGDYKLVIDEDIDDNLAMYRFKNPNWLSADNIPDNVKVWISFVHDPMGYFIDRANFTKVKKITEFSTQVNTATTVPPTCTYEKLTDNSFKLSVDSVGGDVTRPYLVNIIGATSKRCLIVFKAKLNSGYCEINRFFNGNYTTLEYKVVDGWNMIACEAGDGVYGYLVTYFNGTNLFDVEITDFDVYECDGLYPYINHSPLQDTNVPLDNKGLNPMFYNEDMTIRKTPSFYDKYKIDIDYFFSKNQDFTLVLMQYFSVNSNDYRLNGNTVQNGIRLGQSINPSKVYGRLFNSNTITIDATIDKYNLMIIKYRKATKDFVLSVNNKNHVVSPIDNTITETLELFSLGRLSNNNYPIQEDIPYFEILPYEMTLEEETKLYNKLKNKYDLGA